MAAHRVHSYGHACHVTYVTYIGEQNMNWNIARWLNRGARLTLVGVLSLLGFAVVHLVLGGSPALAAPLAAPNDPPTISAIAGQTTPEDVTLGPITFYVSDTETAANALTVTTDPANPALFGTIAQTNSGVTRTLTITPAANAAGSSVVTVTVSDGISTTDEIFLLTVTAVNDVPTISAISDQTIAEDGATSAIGFTVGDVETTAASLQVTATTSNAGLAPLSSIVFGGAGVNRNVTVTPIANANGVAVITVQVSDGTATTNEPFTLTVTAANDAPTVSAIGDQTIVEDSATSALAFTVDDLETAAASLQVTATTNNAGLVPLSGIVFGGSGANRTVTVTPSPNASGSALITVQVSDGTTTTTEPFMVNVTAVNDAPTVSAIADQFIAEDFPTSALAFTVGDLETALGSLQITATTGNAAVVPLSGIVFGGSGANRTVTVTPAPNANGAALITVQVSDGTATATEPFTLNITPTNDVPTISNITGQSTNEDTATGAIAFTVSDVETAPGSLIYSLSAANPALIGSFVFGGSGSARMLVITPAANANGTSVVTVTVSDGAASVSDNFVLTVNAVNDAPVFGVVNDVVVNEDSAPTFNFTISDVDTAIGNVIVTDDNSNNPALVSNVAVSGNTGTRTVNISLVANATGTAQITLIASDQVGGFSSKTFTLTVNGVNDAPTITAIGNQSTNEDTALGPINFMVSDIDSASLTVSASSANQTVVANSGLVVSPATGGNGGRSLTITPVANANGGPTQITVVVNDGQTTAQTVFLLTVNPVNDPPTINAIASQSTNEDTPLNVTVTFSDVDGDALTPSAVAGNATLMPNANLVFSGGGNSRTLTMTPAPDMNGSTLITVTVVDPSGTPALTSFLLTVNPVNDAPTIDNLVQQSGQEDTPFNFSPVVVNDVDSPVNGIVLTATSSNQSLVQNGNISFGGNGNNRSISMTPQPDQSGLVVVSIFASDGQATATRLFNVEFNLSNDAPTISAIANQSTNEDTATGAIAFTVADMDDSASSLNIVSSSSNPTLVPAGNIVPGGSGANRSVTITPAPNQFGTVVISVTVRDAGGLTASSRFTLTVNGVNDAPTISSVGTQFVQESGNSGPIPFTIGDLETTASALVVTVVSSNQSVIQNSGLVLGGSGANRTLTITPVQFQNGSATVTLTVRDPENLSATTQFLVTVDEVNDPPTITQISDVDIPEDSVMGPISFQINDVETPQVNCLQRLRVPI